MLYNWEGHSSTRRICGGCSRGCRSSALRLAGGAFMLLQSSDGKTEAYDMRETAPKLSSPNMYAGNAALKANGILSIAVPGELAGLKNDWKKYDRIPWKRLVVQTARLAKKGFKISPYLHMQIVSSESLIMRDEGLHSTFTSNGSLLHSGDICYNKQLAKTLAMVSRLGTRAFYNGSIRLSLVKDVAKAGGILTMEDLQHYEIKLRKPVSVSVMGVEIFSMPQPSSGGASMSLMLNTWLSIVICLIFPIL